MATNIFKSGGDIGIQEGSRDAKFYNRQAVVERSFNDGTILTLKIKNADGGNKVYEIPFADLTIEGDAPADKAAAVVALATVFPDAGSGAPTLIENQIGFGDGSNLMTGSPNFVWDNSSQTLSDGGANGIEIVATDTKLTLTNNSGNPLVIQSPNGGGVDIDAGIGGGVSIAGLAGITNFTADATVMSYDTPSHTGKFGINTTDPLVALDVIGEINLRNAGGDYNISSSGSALTLHGVDEIDLISSSVIVFGNQLTVDNNSHSAVIGINKGAPAVALDVVGDAHISGLDIQLGDLLGNANGTKFIIDDTAQTIRTRQGNLPMGISLNFSNFVHHLGDYSSSHNGTYLMVHDANQIIKLFSSLGKYQFDNLPQYANRTAALGGGLTAGMIYSLPISGDNKVLCIV